MALQDLTPELRTRLSRMERTVGWFVLLATGLLAFGFFYYVYNTAQRKGWFKVKASYYTYTDAATGLQEGEPVRLMGLDVGRITRMEPMSPENFEYNMYVEFELREPYYGYIWTEGSRARVASADLLGKRFLEVTKGTGGYPTYVFMPFRIMDVSSVRSLPEWENWQLGQDVYDASGTNLVLHALGYLSTNLPVVEQSKLEQIAVLDGRPNQKKKQITAVWHDQSGSYEFFPRKPNPNLYWLKSDESPAVTDRLQKVMDSVEKALPNFLSFTNQIAHVLSNSASLSSNLNAVAYNARPAVSNLVLATAHLDQPGALGEWLLPTNVNRQLEGALGNANAAFATANTNLGVLASNLDQSLINLANLTSNLNSQVQANSNLVTGFSKAIADADNFVQGLKTHWLLRSAFKNKSTNAPPPLRSPKQTGKQ